MTQENKPRKKTTDNQRSPQSYQTKQKIRGELHPFFIGRGRRLVLVSLGYGVVGAVVGSLILWYGWRILVNREDWQRLLSALGDIIGIQIRWQALLFSLSQLGLRFVLPFLLVCSGLGVVIGHLWVAQYRMLRSFFGSPIGRHNWRQSWVMMCCAAISSLVLFSVFMAFALPVIFGITLELMVYTI